MITTIYNKTGKILYICLLAGVGACNPFLDKQPLDKITPDNYFVSDQNLGTYALSYYAFPTHTDNDWGLGTLINDNGTDNQFGLTPPMEYYVKDYWLVPVDNPAWDFERIRAFNYFFEQTLDKYEAGAIDGDPAMIDHYIGEVYFLRAYEYFQKLMAFGDFPIITRTLPQDQQSLVEASKRAPRNQVARFILEDLDKSIELMSNGVKAKNRLTKNAAILFKSRVALYEATFLKYHDGTPRVPNHPDWPGRNMDYNAGFTIDVDAEIEFFLTEAMESAKTVADQITLTENSGVYQPVGEQPYGWNPFFEMYSALDMSGIDEVMLWRAYNIDLISHAVSVNIYTGNNMGATKAMIDAFVMKNGLPIYAAGSGYHGDATIMDAKEDRDDRLQLFIVGEQDRRSLVDPDRYYFGYPTIIEAGEHKDVTGYRVKKCFSYDPDQTRDIGQSCTFGSIVFRGVEAYLNYIEASYLKNGNIDADADRYWRAVRERAGVEPDYNITIGATDLSQEDDWGAYSGGVLVDATLFNIRRERRCELLSESLRMMDLLRWRAMDQVENYIVRGFNLWDEAYLHYVDASGASQLISDGSELSNVSSPDLGKYLSPFQKYEPNNPVYHGLNWSKANYLQPIGFRNIQIASPDQSDVNASTVYQNPYWPVEPGPALE